MFEHEQEIVEALLHENEEFARMYKKHNHLKNQVHEANIGTFAVDDFTLEDMKKQKLRLKDQMAAIIQDYRRAHA